MVAGHCGGVGSAGAGVGHSGDNIGGSTGCGKTDDHVLTSRTEPRNVALAEFLRVLVDLDGRRQSLRSAGHDVLHLSGRCGVGWRAFGRVESGNASAGTGSYVDEPSAVSQAASHLVDN